LVGVHAPPLTAIISEGVKVLAVQPSVSDFTKGMAHINGGRQPPLNAIFQREQLALFWERLANPI
jgi:hypothetical protein